MSGPSSTRPSRTLQERAGGRWAISLQSFFLNAFLALACLLLTEDVPTRSAREALGFVAAWLVGSAVTGTTVWVLHQTVFRNRRMQPVPMLTVTAANMSFGLSYTVVTYASLHPFGIESHLNFVGVVLGNMALTAWWGVTVAVLLDTRDELKSEKWRLVEQAAQSLLIRYQQREFSRALFQEIDREVRDELQPLRDQLAAELQTLNFDGPVDEAAREIQPAVITQLLRDGARDSVRPLSRRLWRTLQAEYPKTPVLQWVSNIWNRQPLRPLVMLAIDFVGTAFDQVERYGLGRALQLMAGVWMWVTVFSLLANSLMKRYPQWHARIFFSAVGVIQLTVLWRSYLRESWQPGSVTLSWQLTQLFFGVFVMLVSSAFGAIRETNDGIRQTFESAVNLEEVDSIARSHRLADIAREAARTLHGSIQTRLIACAMEIELATADGDKDRLRAALMEAVAVLNQPLKMPVVADSLADEIARKVGLWQAFCEFTVDVEEIDCGPTVAQLVARVVEEAISNAIRHGAASSVRVNVRSLSPTRLEVVVIDDGRLEPVTSKGLGSAIIEQASAGDWSLTSDDSHTTLRVSIPFGD